jgi:hypothetical protein
MIESGATAFGEKTAIDALEAGEDHGLADYRSDLKKLAGDAAALVSGQLLPRQEQTHRTMSDLKKEMQ